MSIKGDPREDWVLHCIDCKRDFIFTVGEQDYYRSRRLTAPPRRCQHCRTARRARIVPDPAVKR